MPRKVFLIYHHRLDAFRAGQIRDSGLVEPGDLASDHVWAAITQAGDSSIRRWIDAQIREAECAIVLIGQITAGRKWIDYEIRRAWHSGLGLFGIHVHNLKNQYGSQTSKGPSPFAELAIEDEPRGLAGRLRCYDPPYLTSREAYGYVCDNLQRWVERAIADRQPAQRLPAIRSA